MATTISDSTTPLNSKSSMHIVPHAPLMLKGKLRLDPQRALEPSRKKLSTVESQRIMASLMEAIKRIELVTALPNIMKHLDRYRVVIGQELFNTLKAHTVINESFNELRDSAEALEQKLGMVVVQPDSDEELDSRTDQSSPLDRSHIGDGEASSDSSRIPSTNKGSSAGTEPRHSGSYRSSIRLQLDMTQRNLPLVAKQMQFSCRNILRKFSIDPAALNAVLKDQAVNRTHKAKHLQVVMNELKDFLMGMLLTTPTEETERNLYLKEISQRERNNAAVIQKLELELKAALEHKDDEIRKKNDVIRRVKADLDQIEKFSNESIHRTKTDAEKQETTDLKASEAKRQKLQQDIIQMKTQLQSLITEHRDSELVLRSKKYKIETQVENWIQKYDTDMGERQAEYEEIDLVYTEEKKQLNELEERFKTLQEEYNQIIEERRVARERREAAERELRMAVKAATIIQSFWRSYKVRKALKSKKKKGKKGKKGKK